MLQKGANCGGEKGWGGADGSVHPVLWVCLVQDRSKWVWAFSFSASAVLVVCVNSFVKAFKRFCS